MWWGFFMPIVCWWHACCRQKEGAKHHFSSIKFGRTRKNTYLCIAFRNKARAFSSAGLEHLPYKQRVGGSNPSTPTTQKSRNLTWLRDFFLANEVGKSGSWLSPANRINRTNQTCPTCLTCLTSPTCPTCPPCPTSPTSPTNPTTPTR